MTHDTAATPAAVDAVVVSDASLTHSGIINTTSSLLGLYSSLLLPPCRCRRSSPHNICWNLATFPLWISSLGLHGSHPWPLPTTMMMPPLAALLWQSSLLCTAKLAFHRALFIKLAVTLQISHLHRRLR
jgi:hypothetical protein